MPQMLEYCGKRLRVYKRAHKTCDTVNKTGGVRMKDAVHLEGIRCDGQVYGGCEASCMIFWKEAWLKRAKGKGVATAETKASESHPQGDARPASNVCSVEDVMAGTRAREASEGKGPIYVCQITQLPKATTPLDSRELSQYWQDLTSGNVGPVAIFKGFVYATYHNLIESGRGPTAFLKRFYDSWQSLWGGVPYPRKRGTLPDGERAPSFKLNLQKGEYVRVKPYEEILKTLHKTNKNHGLYFDAEMVPYCGGVYRVLKRVSKILNEETGEMLNFKNECIILEGVVCESRYSDRRYFCPRAIYSYWREIWLERVDKADEPELAACAPEQSNEE